jgi:hypothetical protein
MNPRILEIRDSKLKSDLNWTDGDVPEELVDAIIVSEGNVVYNGVTYELQHRTKRFAEDYKRRYYA